MNKQELAAAIAAKSGLTKKEAGAALGEDASRYSAIKARLKPVQLREGSRRHGAGGADLRLAAGLRARDRSVGLDELPYEAGHGERLDDLVAVYAEELFFIIEHGGQNA